MTRRFTALGLGTVLLLAGCATNSGADDGARGSGGELTIFAAASLHRVFEEIADQFTADTGTEVTFSFAGSSDLVAQLRAGAPADVLATADESTMTVAVDHGVIAEAPQIFAANTLTLITPAGNPAGVTGLDDSLGAADLVVCAPQVPCGAATVELTALLGVSISPVSEASNVTDVLGMVTAGQADAGLVYTTDAVAAEDVHAIPIERADEVVNTYPIAVTAHSAAPGPAAQWVDYVLGPQAQQVLAAAGFTTP